MSGEQPAGFGPPDPSSALPATGAPAAPPTRLADGEWHRLHPATPLLRGGIAFIAILGVVIVNLRDLIIEIVLVGPEGQDDPLIWIIEHDYALSPAKPTLDAEPNYEDHPIDPWPAWNPANGYYRDHDVRQQSYRSVFAGGCGVTYGHHAVWQFCGTRDPVVNHADRPWTDALDRLGATQMVHLRRLMESRPYFSRIPDQIIVVDNPAERGSHMRSTRDEAGSYALVYTPLVQPVTVQLGWAAGNAVRAWWYNPRTGGATEIGRFAATGQLTFMPPVDGPDWVLVLDDAAADFGKPGAE